jgi:hypothetical protein
VNIPRTKTRQQGDPLHPSDPLSDEPMEWPSKTKAYIIDLVQIAGIQVPASDVQGLYNTADDINGLGSPIHGAPRMLRLGTTPYEFIPLIYDEVYGKWVSTTLYQAVGRRAPSRRTRGRSWSSVRSRLASRCSTCRGRVRSTTRSRS